MPSSFSFREGEQLLRLLQLPPHRCLPKEGYYCFHAGTKVTEDGVVTNGGRVLGITAKGNDLKEARANAYEATKWVNFDNKYMRNDIGKAIDEA